MRLPIDGGSRWRDGTGDIGGDGLSHVPKREYWVVSTSTGPLSNGVGKITLCGDVDSEVTEGKLISDLGLLTPIQCDLAARRSVIRAAFCVSGGTPRGFEDVGLFPILSTMGRASGSRYPKPTNLTCGESVVILPAERSVPTWGPFVIAVLIDVPQSPSARLHGRPPRTNTCWAAFKYCNGFSEVFEENGHYGHSGHGVGDKSCYASY